MTLKQLEAFYWAARCSNFSIAAERLHISISSLSKRIVELEASLGCTLFDRSDVAAEFYCFSPFALSEVAFSATC
ncbi:LysR family substrate-binding transcriptional regulator [Yersinia pseudotuberculosis]|nr:LysR family substrate-binding transcriptional regulator [Yersinia pseudotuberculosis]